ncbi:hypothetical protein I551_8912 [Mycobacterium ulcerans str. Harvey]|uniref:DUF58 domain-containing protein n=1 Tax=Mycobacterium ulcerans str. Harvey TaxID=1299332 RepID=A0ABP3AS15_MYCUL|nr:hypothetical protein I551_8912 [Mycobacterium ulcerans str. Harvey]
MAAPAWRPDSNGATLTRVPARSGRQHLQTMLRTIATTPKAPVGVRGDLAVAIDALRRPERRRGMAVIISDFLGPINWMRPLRAISARHEVLAIEVLDPRDVELPDIGDVVLQDAETGVTREFTSMPSCRTTSPGRPRRTGPTWSAPSAVAGHRSCRFAPTAIGSPTSSVSSLPPAWGNRGAPVTPTLMHVETGLL